jgi:mono/diheme cytochrome c family protein
MYHFIAYSRIAVLGLLLGFGFAGHAGAAAAVDPELTFQNADQKITFKRSELLKRSDLETLSVQNDPAYPGQGIRYRAVRFTALFGGLKIADEAVIQFRSLDGFSAPISKERLLNKLADKSIAYIAIEEPDKPWPPLKPGGGSAGPFYLIWQKPEASFIGPEEWPYQVVAFEVKGTLESLYPNILPDAKLEPTSPVRQGFKVFTKNCFACHTLNRDGAGDVGPDLNVPMNPTEYFHKAALRKLVRDPQSLRHFPRSRMSAFPREILPEQDLDHLIAYLEHMAQRKVSK